MIRVGHKIRTGLDPPLYTEVPGKGGVWRMHFSAAARSMPDARFTSSGHFVVTPTVMEGRNGPIGSGWHSLNTMGYRLE